MISSTSIKIIIFALVIMLKQSTGAPATPDGAADLVMAGIEGYKEIIKHLKIGIEGLFIGENLKEIANTLSELNYEMGEEQEKAMDVIITINTDALLAIQSARNVVVKLKNICNSAKHVLDLKKNEEYLRIGVKVFLQSSTRVTPEVEKAIEKLTKVIGDSAQVNATLISLTRWAEIKKQELSTMSEAQILEARAKAYGGSAVACIIPLINIIACPLAFSIAAGITEGKNVKEIQEIFDTGIEKIDIMKDEINEMGFKTNELVKQVRNDHNKMMDINDKLDEANLNADLFLNISVDIFFNPFKEAVNVLYIMCTDFLASNSVSVK